DGGLQNVASLAAVLVHLGRSEAGEEQVNAGRQMPVLPCPGEDIRHPDLDRCVRRAREVDDGRGHDCASLASRAERAAMRSSLLSMRRVKSSAVRSIAVTTSAGTTRADMRRAATKTSCALRSEASDEHRSVS